MTRLQVTLRNELKILQKNLILKTVVLLFFSPVKVINLHLFMHLTPDFTTPGHDSGLKYFIICLLNSDIPFRFSHFFENGAFRIYGTFCGKFLSHDLHQNNSVSLMNESYSKFFV